jgi:hypothetical protein
VTDGSSPGRPAPPPAAGWGLYNRVKKISVPISTYFTKITRKIENGSRRNRFYSLARQSVRLFGLFTTQSEEPASLA